MCILLNVKKHEKTFALNVDIFTGKKTSKKRVQNRSGYVRMVSGNRNLSYEGGCVL